MTSLKLKARLREFIKDGQMELNVNSAKKEIRMVGLRWGESKRLAPKFKRKEQIFLLDKLTDDKKLSKELFTENLGEDLFF